MIVGEAALHEFLGGVTLGDGPLTTTIESKPLGVGMNAPSNDIDGLIPRDVFEATVATQLRRGETVATVEDAPDMVALHTEETLVDVGFLVAADGGALAMYVPVGNASSSTIVPSATTVPVWKFTSFSSKPSVPCCVIDFVVVV